jgi:hypothetical protein
MTRTKSNQQNQPVLKRSFGIEREAINVDDRTVSLSFSSEEPVVDWPGEPPQVLLHSKKAAKLQRIRDVGGVLFNHKEDEIVASILDIYIDEADRKGRATIQFDETPEGDKAFSRVKSRSLKGVSVSAIPRQRQLIEEGETWRDTEGREFTGPLHVAKTWEVIELSLTPIPADAGVGIGRTLEKEVKPMKLPAELRELLISKGLTEGASDDDALEFARTLSPPVSAEEKTETKSVDRKTDDNDPVDLAARMAKAKAAERDAIARERIRIEDLRAIQAKSGVPDEELHRWIQEGTDTKSAGELALEFMAARHRPVSPSGQHVEVVLEAREKVKRAMESHLCRRAVGYLGGNPQSWTYDEKACEDVPADMPAVEVARRCLIHAGHRDAAHWDKQTVATRGMQHSTSDFPYLLANVAQKSLGVGYDEARTTWQAWCGTGSLPDFKSASRVAVGDTDSFEIVQELMPITESTMSEKRETRNLSTYAKRFGVSRQAIINDDLAEFSRIPQKLGAAAARTVNSTVYGQLTGTVTMAEDSTALFATTHPSGSNYTSSSGGAPAAAQLNTAMSLMRKQKGVGAVATLNITPQFLIAPAALEGSVRTLIESTYVPATQANAAPKWMLNITPVIEPLLDASSAAVWYMAASPNEMDTIRVEFLNGQQTPQLVEIDGTAILGKEWIAYLDFSVKTFDHRGLYKNIGA